jgi:transposase
MRLKISSSKNSTSLYVIKSYRLNGKNTSKVIEKLGTIENIMENYNTNDAIAWAKNYINELNIAEKKAKNNESENIQLNFSSNKLIKPEVEYSFNIGYLFIQKIYYQLGLDKICDHISTEYKYTFDLNDILSRLIYARILEPCSKRSSFEFSKKLIEKPKFQEHHIYRALDVINKASDYIETEVYNNSSKINNRNTRVLYYDCTNYYFEIDDANGLKQYGISKEHRPNPIVQMGLFIDGDGLPLSFCINDGNQNEQTTLKPLEKRIIRDFELSQFVVCTDGGLSSTENRKFNNISKRAFITVQSLKKIKKSTCDWALKLEGWKIPNSDVVYNLNEIDENQYYNTIFYKERWINENNLEQRIIITFSFKYKAFLRSKRQNLIEKAKDKIKNPSKFNNKKNSERYIDKCNITKDGETAADTLYSLDHNAIEKDEKFDGFYAVCTNLEDNVKEIIKINKRRWEIEESFKILKTEFKARPVYLRRDERIKAHFMTCFLSLLILRLIEKKTSEEFSSRKILQTLKNMKMYQTKGEGYIPLYKRTSLTDELHDKFGLRTDYEIVTNKKIKKIIKDSKLKNITTK